MKIYNEKINVEMDFERKKVCFLTYSKVQDCMNAPCWCQEKNACISEGSHSSVIFRRKESLKIQKMMQKAK